MSRSSHRPALRSALAAPSIIGPAAVLALAAGASTSACNVLLGLDAYYDCPEDPRCPPPDAGTGGNGGSAPSCTSPADCPGGDDCASPICTGGKCGLAAKPDGTACMATMGAGFQCEGGACMCPIENACGAACVDKQIDPAHCGACDSACPTGIACESGACACPGGGIVCDGACVDEKTDTTHCGTCGHACTVAGATCDLGLCMCPGGGTECSGSCVDTDTDLANCGTCGKACTATGATCDTGMCVCPGGGTDCSGACVDTNTDGTNCGTCGTVCEANLQGSVCNGSTCECPGTLTACSGVCLDLATDPLNCGACGHDCLGGGCQAGLCQPVTLSTGETSPTDIAVSSTHVYWINPGVITGMVRRVPIGGGAATTVANSQTAPAYLAVDSANVYWTYTTGIRKAPLAGGAASLVTSWASGIVAEVLATDGNYVYWNRDHTDFWRAPVTGGAPIALPYDPIYATYGLAVDATNLYWAANGRLSKAPKDGSGIVADIGGGDAPFMIHGGNIYGGVAGIGYVSIDGTNGMPLTMGMFPLSTSIAVDGAHVYWSAQDGNLRRVPITGGATVLLAGGATRVAVDSTYVYWTDASAGRIFRAAK